MNSRFTAEQRRALQDLLGLPDRLSKHSRPNVAQISIPDLCRAMGRPEPRFHHLLGPDRWQAGGSVVGWLFGGFGPGGDHDFFFPSAEAFNRFAHQLLARHGFVFRSFWTYMTICLLCGRPGQLVRHDEVDDLSYPLPRVHCRDCGEFGGVDAGTLAADRLLRITPELVEKTGMRALELLSPEGDLFHLAPVQMAPTPQEVIGGFDVSVVQLAFDNRNLYFSPYAWTDILLGRLRITGGSHRPVYRLRKYAGRGFRPYPESVVRALIALWSKLRGRHWSPWKSGWVK